MDLYIYKTGTKKTVLTIEDVISYTADKVVTEEGVCAPFAEDVEFSSLPDCSETLRADWRRAHPSQEERLDALDKAVGSTSGAAAIAFVVLAEGGGIDGVTAGEHIGLFSPWACPVDYKTGNIRRFAGGLYRCLQDHTSQEDWTPDTAASLWVKIADPAEEWPEWSRPLGAHDAYNEGDKVSHKGKRWVSTVSGNVWEPGVYGWSEA